MSSIDQYKHSILDFIELKFHGDFDIPTNLKKIAIYQLNQDIPADEVAFDGKENDIILGGGSGEISSLRISLRKSIEFFLLDNFDDFENYDQIYKSFWKPSDAFIIGLAFTNYGWKYSQDLAMFVSKYIIEHLNRNNKIKI